MKRFLKTLFLILIGVFISFKSPAWYQLVTYQGDRDQLIEENILASSGILNRFPTLPYMKNIPADEEYALMFALMVLEKNPEGISQLEMIFRANDKPLVMNQDKSGFFENTETLTQLYQGYLNRLKVNGENAAFIKRTDLVGFSVDDEQQGSQKNIQHIAVTSDFQMRDEESPLHLYPAKPFFPTSYYPASPHIPYIVDDAIKTLRDYEQAENIEMDFAIFTGDLTDNGHYNEVRWGIDVLDGGEVNPDTGLDDDIFEGYYLNGEPNDTADAFTAVGLKGSAEKNTKTIPWYFVHGNHDGLAMGVFNMTYEPLDLLFTKLENGTFGFLNDISIGNYNYLGLIPNPRSLIQYVFSDEEGKNIVSDRSRRLLNAEEISQEMFNTSGLPKGHGMQYVDDIKKDRSYSFISDNGLIKNIILDTNANQPMGSFPDEKMEWLENELDLAAKNKQLVILSSHHKPVEIFDNGLAIIDLLHKHPNVIAHLVAHWHRNNITPQLGDTNEGSYWQIETASMVNWPQQLRILDVQVDKSTGQGIIKSTMLNHHSKNPYAISQRGRFLAYLEAYLNAGELALVRKEGEAKDRNALLYFKVPEHFLSSDIQLSVQSASH